MNFDNVKLFEDLMSGDKETMRHAETRIKNLKSLSLDQGLNIFVQGMQAEKPLVAQLATLMLKKTYLDDEEIMKAISTEQIELLKATLKSFVAFEGKDWKSLQRIADALAKVYALSDLGSSFNDIMIWFRTEKPLSKQFALYLIEVLCDLAVLKDQIVKESVNDFTNIFTQALSDPDLNVRVTALQAATQFLNNLKENETVMKFTSLAENLLESLIYVLKNDTQIGKSALSALNNLTESHPKFWKEKLEVLIGIVCEIAGEAIFSNDIRESALEIVYGIGKKSPAFLRKSENFKNLFIPVLFKLLLDIDNVNNLEEWSKQTEETEEDFESMYFGARDGLSRLSVDLGGKSFAEMTIPHVKNLLASENWVDLHGAFIAIGYLAQGCQEIFKSYVVELLNYISNALVHSHPRVIFAALTALGLLLEELAPTIQKKFHSNILPALCKLMSFTESPGLSIRVRTSACSALVNFLRGMIDKDSKDDDHEDANKIIKPHAESILQIVSALFENSLSLDYAPLQDETLTALSLLATVLDKDFAAFYPSIMPGLKQIFYTLQPTNNQQANLKANAIETISYLCSSISENAEKFLDDLKELSEGFSKLMSSLKEEDPQVPALLTAFSHISTSMREHFYPYLEYIFPVLENYILADIGFKLEDADLNEYMPEDMTSKEDNKLSVILQVQGLDNKRLSMNSYALQNKIMALNVLHEICLNMGEKFHPFLEKFLVLTKNLLKFPYSRKVRKLCIKALYAGILTCKNDEEQKSVFDFYSNDYIAVFDYNIKSRLLREIKTYLKVLTFTCEEIKNKNVYSIDFVTKLFQSLESVIKFVEEHKNKVKEIVKNDEGLDENDDEILESDISILNETNRRVMELSGILFKTFKADLTPLVDKHLYTLFLNNWTHAVTKTKNDQEMLNSICFFDDYLNYAAFDHFKLFCPRFFELAVDLCPTKSEDVIQSVVYGLGVIAERLPKEDFISVHAKVINYIVEILKRNVTDANSFSFDNAIGALGKYAYCQASNDQNGITLVSQFVSLLPLKFDLEEGESVLTLFFRNILNNHPLLVNETVLPLVREAILRISDFRKNEEEILSDEGVELFLQVCLGLGIGCGN